MPLKWWRDDKILLLQKTIEALEQVIRGYQEENKYLIEKLAGGEGGSILIPKVVDLDYDDEALTAGVIAPEGEKEDGEETAGTTIK